MSLDSRQLIGIVDLQGAELPSVKPEAKTQPQPVDPKGAQAPPVRSERLPLIRSCHTISDSGQQEVICFFGPERE